MRKLIYKSCFSIPLFLILLINGEFQAQQFTEAELKAAFIYSFGNYVEWADESQFSTFTIGVLGNKSIYSALQVVCMGRRLKEKHIEILLFSSIDKIKKTQMLFVSKKSNISIDQILEKISGNNTLLVSENYDFHTSMINFITVDNQRKFEINQDIINRENLKVSSKLIALAVKTEADWQQLYLKTSKLLEKEKVKVKLQHDEILEQQKTIETKTEVLERQGNEIKMQLAEIQNKKKELARQKDILGNQKREIGIQQDRINRQKKILNEQLEKINMQRLILYLFIALIVVISGFGFFIYRGYKIKKQKNQELQEKNIQIHERNEKIFRQNEELEKLSVVASKTDNSVLIANGDGELNWVNDGFTRLYGYTLEEYCKQHGSNIFEASSNPNIRETIKDSIENKKSVVYSSQATTKDGRTIWLQTTLTPIIDSDGNLSKLIAIDSDITKIKLAEEQIKKQHKQIELEKEKSEKLLLNILPATVASDLKEKGESMPEIFKNVTVYFSDVVGFTKLSAQLDPKFLINELSEMFTAFDYIIEANQCERIKTIGDAYLAVCGMPDKNKDHAQNMINSAIDILKYINKRNQFKDVEWQIRIGIHTGKVVGGVVGVKKYIYDVFGDTINTASRMESNSEPMKINISEVTYKIVKDKFNFTERPTLKVKGKGEMKMYFVNSRI